MEEIKIMRLCDYGCGQEAKIQFKNGKMCCNKNIASCPKIKESNIGGSKRRGKTKENDTGRKSQAEKLTGRTKENHEGRRKQAEKLTGRTKETHDGVRKGSEKRIGRTSWNRNLTKETDSRIEKSSKKISEKTKGKKKKPFTNDHKKNIGISHIGISPGNKGKKYEDYLPPGKIKNIKDSLSKISKKRLLNGGAVYLNSLPKRGYKNHKEWMLNEGANYANSFPVMGYKNNKEWMNNEGPAYINSFIKNPSKPELELRKIVNQILPYVIHNYPIYRVGKRKRSYNVDNAIPKLSLIIEYDGWYHFDTEEHKKYHKQRQKEIEEEGWKFLRYNIFQKFPTIEQVKKDIKKVMEIDYGNGCEREKTEI